MKLSNQLFNELILRGLRLEIGQEIRLKSIWNQLVLSGYREELLKFMEVLEVRFPKDPNVSNEILQRALGATDSSNLREKKFRILAVEIKPVEDSDYVEDKGLYKVECIGAHYDESNSKWAEKPTILFSLKLE